MDTRFSPHNAHLENPAEFDRLDPHLRHLRRRQLVHRSHLIDALPIDTPGIYTIGGGRQVGKTTLMKQWMAELLRTGADPRRLRYFTGLLGDVVDY